jgi:phytoene dehydrogenase-like protein
VMTPTSTDDSLAPEGRHVVTVWTQWHPRDLADGGWDDVREREGDRIVAALESWSPGFADGVIERLVQTPLDLERELDLRRGNVMHVEMSLDAMFGLRPLPQWSGYRGPREGLFLCGASTHPGGGVSGMSGRTVADVVLRSQRGRLRRRRG